MTPILCTRRQVLIGFFGLVAGGSVATRFALRKTTAAIAKPELPFPPPETRAFRAALEHALPGALEALRIATYLGAQIVLGETLGHPGLLEHARHEPRPHRIPPWRESLGIDVARTGVRTEEPRCDVDRPRGLGGGLFAHQLHDDGDS